MVGDSSFLKCVLAYPDATLALGEFRETVQQRCLKVFERHIEELAAALGYERKLQAAVGSSYPDRPKANEKEFFAIGAKVAQKDGTEFHARLCWSRNPSDRSKDSVYLSIYAWFKTLALRAGVAEQFDAANSDLRFKKQSWYCEQDMSYPEIYLDLEKEQITQFDTHLDTLFKWTIEIVKSRPKIKKLVRASLKP